MAKLDDDKKKKLVESVSKIASAASSAKSSEKASTPSGGKVSVKKATTGSSSSKGASLKKSSGTQSSPVSEDFKKKGQEAAAAKKTKWYKGDKPTRAETAAQVYREGTQDPSRKEELNRMYQEEISNPESIIFEKYAQATSPYLSALGVDASQVNDDFFAENAHLYSAGVHTSTGALSSAKKNGPEAMLAYNLSGLQADYNATKELKAEEAQILAEAKYWIDKGLTDDEIKEKLNIGGEGTKYTKTKAALDATALGKIVPTTEAIPMATSYGVDGMLWALRNPELSKGDYELDAIQKELGRGNGYTASEEDIARRTRGSATWAPYSNGTTLDDEAIRFGVTEFSPDWFEKNRDAILASGDEDAIDAMGNVFAAESFTAEAEKEAADFRYEVDSMLESGLSPEEIFTADFLAEYPSLQKMYDGYLTGQPVDVTRSVDFDIAGLKAYAQSEYDLRQAQKNAPKDPVAMQTAVDAEKQAVVATNGTLIEPETTPQSQTNKQTSILEKRSDKIAKGGILWASAGASSGVSSYVKDEYANWTDAQKMAAQTYISDLKDGEDTEYAVEEMRLAGLTDEQIEHFKQSEMVNPQPKDAPEAGAETEQASEPEKPSPEAVNPDDVADLAPILGGEEEATKYLERQNATAAVHEAISLGDFTTAAELQYGLISGLLQDSDDAYAQELVHSEGSQEAAASLMAMVMESGMPKMLDDADIRAQLSVFEGYANEAFGIEQKPLTDFVSFLDRILNMNGSLVAAQQNDGLGLTATLQMALDSTAYKITDLADKFIGSVITGAGEVTNNDKLIEKGQKIASEMEATIAGHDEILRQNGTPLEIISAQALGEMAKMQTLGKASEFLNAGASVFFGEKFKWLTRFVASTPFAAESGIQEFDEAYEKTGGDYSVSFLSGAAASASTMLLSKFDGILNNIEAKGMPFIPELVETLSTVPGSGVKAGAARWGKAFSSWLWNLAKTGINEAVQEPAENVATTFLTELIQGENPLDRDWSEYGKELLADGAMAFILSIGSSVSTMPTYANSVKVAEAQMGQSMLTPQDVDSFMEAVIADMDDPTIVEEATRRATDIAVETRTGELVAEGAAGEVDMSGVNAAQERVGEAETTAAETATALQAATDAALQANDALIQNPADASLLNDFKSTMQDRDKAEAENVKAQKELQEARQELNKEQTAVSAQTDAAVAGVRAQAAAEVEQARGAIAQQLTEDTARGNEELKRGYEKKQYIPYEGDVPVSQNVSSEAVSVEDSSFSQAQEVIASARAEAEKPGRVKAIVKKAYTTLFGDRFDKKRVTVPGISFNGDPYVVTIYKNIIGKVISDPGLSAEKLSVLSSLEQIIENSSYADSSDVDRSTSKKENVVRYDYLTSPARINGKDYDVRLVVEAYSDANKLKTYLLKEIELVPSDPVSLGHEPGPEAGSVTTPEISIPDSGQTVNNPSQDIEAPRGIPTPPPGMGVSQFAGQTGQNTPVLSDEVKQQLHDSPYYKKTNQKKNVDAAIALIDQEGYEARKNKLLDGTTDVMTPEGQAEAYVLVKAAKANGDLEGESAIAFRVKESGTTLGQAMAMRRLYVEMTPAGKARFVQRIVDQINRENSGKNTIEMPPWLEAELEKADGNDKQMDAVLDEAYRYIATQMRPSFADRINTWRYLAMLGNPLTHSKNLLANLAQVPYVMIKNKTAALGEVAVQGVRSAFGKETTRTKSLRAIKQEYRDLAKQAFSEVESQLKGEPTSPMAKINDWRAKSWGWMDKASRFNSDLMSREDMLFKKSYFVNAMASYLQANNVDASNPDAETMSSATEYAFNEAMKNTFNNANAFAEWLTSAQTDARKRGGAMKLADVAISAVMPFKKTPANVILRGVEYSPVGLLNAITMNTVKLIRGKDFSGRPYTVNQWVDSIASGLTGSMAVGMGAFLASIGVLDLGTDEDDELRGNQENSVNILGHNISIDSFGSAAMPLLMGAKIFDLRSEEDNEDGMLARLLSVLGTIADPVMELSAMQGVNSLLSSASYSDNSLAAIGQRAGSSFLSQFVPSVFGAIARTVDDTRRTVYMDKNNPMDSQTQYFLQSLRNKIPGLSEGGVPYLDVWGDEVSNGTPVMRFLSNFLIPGYPKEQQDPDAVTQRLLDLFDETGNADFLPKEAGKSFTADGEKYNLSAEEYQRYAKDRGDRAKAILESLFASDEFNGAADAYKLEAVEKVWEYSTKMAAHSINENYKVGSEMLNAEDPTEYVLNKMRGSIKSDQQAEYTKGAVDAIAAGDLQSAEACVEGLRQTGMQDKSIKSKMTSQYKAQYRELYEAEDYDGMRDLEKSLILLGIGYKKSEFTKWLEEE